VETLELGRLSGIVEYQSSEFTFTALAGTPLALVNQVLAEYRQYLPFDPLLAERGATLGGTVAAGVSGPGRYHYGGVRDFILGIRYVNGEGELVRSGGKVVKNAAGFDFSKLMVGSRGELGALVELSFKVFPKPQTFATLVKEYPHLDDALQGMQKAGSVRLDIDAIDLAPLSEGSSPSYGVWVRLGGLSKMLPVRLQRLGDGLGPGRVLQEGEDSLFWQQARELAWVPPGWSLIKVPLTPKRIFPLETALNSMLNNHGTQILRRYSAAGQVAWLACPGLPDGLSKLLTKQNLVGLVLFGEPGQPQLGQMPGEALLKRVQTALDPAHRFASAF
jgi:glycolate oxidase FAD binding subunit